MLALVEMQIKSFAWVLISTTGTKATPAEQLSVALAWDRADIAQKEILVAGQHWQVRWSRRCRIWLKKSTKRNIKHS